MSVSPRTAAHPMAFTFCEFANGAAMAWLFSLGFAVVGNGIIALGALPVVLMIVVPVSVVALLIGSPVAYGLGWVLRGVGSRGIHLAAFAAFGALVALVAVFSVGGGDGALSPLLWGLNAVAGAAGVALGWRWSMLRAIRSDLTTASASSAAPVSALGA